MDKRRGVLAKNLPAIDLTAASVEAALVPWYRRHRRRFSFRRRPTPYKILLAEILLRKTRAADVDPVFAAMYRRYPTPRSLARARVEELGSLVSPLGLPKRAFTLRALGEVLVQRHRGGVPRSREDLERLPGVGPYAAGAVLSLGFDEASPMVDGPLGRMLARLSGTSTQRTPHYERRVWKLASDLLPTTRPRRFQLAMIDVAALCCRRHSPLCQSCPLMTMCSYAAQARRQAGETQDKE